MEFSAAMTELFQKVFHAYVDKKKEKFLIPDDPYAVFRGTIVSNSSVYENNLALMIHSQLHNHYQVLVEYPLIFPGRNNRITPDITIIRNNIIEMILELKIDLGYEEVNWIEEKEDKIKTLKRYKNDTKIKLTHSETLLKKDELSLKVSDNLQYATVIFCHKNGAQKIKIIQERITQKKEQGTRDTYPFFILLNSKSKHPNDFTSYHEADQYLQLLKDEEKEEWLAFERYLRNRLIFKK